jgi:DNA-binding NarL/FixJ family response regulator
VSALSPRQLEVAALAAARLRNGDIAARLGISKRTVGSHLVAAYRRTGTGGGKPGRSAGARTRLAEWLWRETEAWP